MNEPTSISHRYNDSRSFDTFNFEDQQAFVDVTPEQKEAAEDRLADLIEETRKELE